MDQPATSWWLKYERAQAHRREAKAMVEAATAPQPIRIEKAFNDGFWEYTVHHDALVDSLFPVVLGDFLFNLRSALDHVAAAHRIKKTPKAPFPIFHDPIMVLPKPGEPDPFRRYRDIWRQVEKNTQPDVFRVMNAAQPFNVGPEFDPANAGLAILNELQNRDKHASLAVISTGVADIQSWVVPDYGERVLIPGPNMGDGFVPNGARIFRERSELWIECEGRVRLATAAGPTSEFRALPEVLDDLSVEVEALLKEIDRVVASGLATRRPS